MQKLFFILTGLIFLNSAQAQKHCNPGGYAFSILIQPGTIPVDENGNRTRPRLSKEHFIYITTSGKMKPIINSIFFGKTAVKWDVPGPAETGYSAVTQTTQKTISIKPFKGCSLWRINIQEFANHPIAENSASIIIKGKADNKSFSLVLNKETAVQGYDTY